MMKIAALALVIHLSLTALSCVNGNVCQRRLEFEEDECFVELDQPTYVERDACADDEKLFSRCAMQNEDAYCDYFLWQNRGAARREGYTVSDYLAPNNDFVECLDAEGIREQ